MFRKNLENEVDKYLEEQSKLDEKSRKLIDLFNKTYSKKEVAGIVEFLIENSADHYKNDIDEFKKHYESDIKSEFSVKDIKTFIALYKVYKDQMKEQKPSNGNGSVILLDQNKQAQKEIAEGENE